MRVGADLFRLPDWHPVRLAEDVAMVDILSNGRVMFKAGAGGPFPPSVRVWPKIKDLT
jgi:alkanesulfonate monooxygenase SsuD/methylene tetrahydromethanopterin reductase-like flavin-dependent oxidoreductase (luciferase family)